MSWTDFFKLFTYSFEKDPLSRKTDKRQLTGAGVTQPDAMPDLRSGDGMTAGAGAFIRVKNDLIDLTSTTNRLNRYKEYDRLATTMPEIDMAMTVFADEACVAGETEIETVMHGPKTIEWLAENMKEERFGVYCYDFKKEDYAIGWAYDPRLVKEEETVKIYLDNGEYEIVTKDHRCLKRDGTWVEAGDLEEGDELMPFYRIKPRRWKEQPNTHQFPRIFTHNKGWMEERQFIEYWKTGKDYNEHERGYKVARLLADGLSARKIQQITGLKDWRQPKRELRKIGFCAKECRWLGQKEDRRYVIGIEPYKKMKVYDLSVDKHENFCTTNMVMHNCQRAEDGKVFKIRCKNKEVVNELEHLFFHRDMLNFNQREMWNRCRSLFIKGDEFWEIVIFPDDPKAGIQKVDQLPADTMYRIETTKGKLLEFQQGKEGPDFNAIQKAPVATATEQELAQSTAIRFAPEQIVHLRVGDYRKSFYPYGVSLIEPARGPAHQLRMMEDAMVVYRLTRAPERRVFYVDVGQLPSFKAEAFVERLKDQFRKKKVVRNNANSGGASAVEERWHAPAADEDFWLPTRPNSNTRIETLPGAQNLGEIDDTVYFRNKLFQALHFPLNYFSNEDPNATRITLSAQDVKFARYIERLQSYVEDALWMIADRHLRLIGVPEDKYEDLELKMTPPSDWRELSRAEVVTNRINNANSIKGSQLMSDYDILVRIMQEPHEDAVEIISRLKVQKLEDLKLQIMAQNPDLLGIGVPGQGEQEMGAEPGGPNPMVGADQGMPPGGGMPGMPPPAGPEQGGIPPMPEGGGQKDSPSMMPDKKQAKPLPDPDHKDIIKYDLDIQDYDSDQDREDIDFSEIP